MSSRSRYRVKLVIPAVGDTQMFYPVTRVAADEMMRCFRDEVLSEVDGSVFLYVETPHGHVRVA